LKDFGKPSQIVTSSSKHSECACADRRLLVFPLVLGVLMMVTNRWFTEVDDECAIIDQAVHPLSRTLELYWGGIGQHEHPPAYDIFLHGWLRFTSGNIHLLRLPSIVFYLLGAWILAGVAKKLGGARSQFWTLVIVTLWPFGFHFGRLTTWYSLCFLLVSWLTLAYFNFVDQPCAKNWLWVLLAAVVLVYSNYFGWALLACLAFDYLIRNRRDVRAALRWLSPAAAILLVAYVPLFHALHRETEFGIRPNAFSAETLANVAYNIYCVFVSESAAPWFWFLGVPACIAIAMSMFLCLWRTPSPARAFLLYFAALVALLAVLSAVVPKRMLLLSPWLILPMAVALGMRSDRGGRRVLAGALAVVVGIGWFGIFSRRFYGAPHWIEPWASIANDAAGVVHEGGVVVADNPSFFFYLTYLLPMTPVVSGAADFAGLLPDSVHTPGVYSTRQWMAANHPVAGAVMLVKGLHYGSSAERTEQAQARLDAYCKVVKTERMVHDPGAELKEHYTRIMQPEWRIEVRAYACP